MISELDNRISDDTDNYKDNQRINGMDLVSIVLMMPFVIICFVLFVLMVVT